MSEKNEWHSGFVATYFQIIETSADGHYNMIRRRIRENNEAIARGSKGEFGRHIEVKELKADVALHYLIDFSQDRLREAVNLGVNQAREWCKAEGIDFKPIDAGKIASPPDEKQPAITKITFTEEMQGYLAFGELDYEPGFLKGKKDNNYLRVHLTISIADVDRFVSRPEHEATIEGYVYCDALGGELPATGLFNLFTDEADPAIKRMSYRLFFEDLSKRPLTLSGHKVIRDDPGADLWPDTTTLFTHLLKGQITSAEEAVVEKEPGKYADITVAAGILHIGLGDFLKLLTTFRVEGESFAARNAARLRFSRLFFGKLWDVYARGLLTSGPF